MLARRFGTLFVVMWLFSLPVLGQVGELGPPIGLHEAKAGSLLFCPCLLGTGETSLARMNLATPALSDSSCSGWLEWRIWRAVPE